MNRPSITASLTMIAAGALVAGCNRNDTSGVIRASGHIEATEVHISAKVGGRLLEAPLEEGQAVSAGDLVARIETVDFEHLLAQARAEEQAADAQLRLLLKGTRVEDLQRAEDQLAQRQAELDAARRDLTRLAGLAERGTATEKARDDAATREEVAERGVAAARSQLDKLVSGPRREEIEAARAARAAVRARIGGINQQITDATVLAPRDGVITSRVAEDGEILRAGAPICVLADLARPWLAVYVDQPNLARVKLGAEVEVMVDGIEESMVGRVSFVSPVAEFTPKNVQTPEERAKLVFRVKIDLDNSSGVFKVGMPADAILALGTTESQ